MKAERIFVSLPADEWLTKQENKTKWAIVTVVEDLGYTTEVFLDPRHALTCRFAGVGCYILRAGHASL